MTDRKEKATSKSDLIPRFYGASEGTRTLDLRFTKPMLYQLSYAGLFFNSALDGSAWMLLQAGCNQSNYWRDREMSRKSRS
jgi:hypothetical protein